MHYISEFNEPEHLMLHSFFRGWLKHTTVDRSALDTDAYNLEHNDFYCEALKDLVPVVWGGSFAPGEKIYDLGGQSGRLFGFLRYYIQKDSFLVIDRFHYANQERELKERNELPTVIQECWFDYFERCSPSEEKSLFIFSFSINECQDFDSQITLLKTIKSKFPNSKILILDKAFLINELHLHFRESRIFDVNLRLARPLYQFSDGHYLRRKLEEKALCL